MVSNKLGFDPSLLFTGIIFSDENCLDNYISSIQTHFCLSVMHRSPIFDFTHTSYYEDEMGTPLKRVFLSFSPLVEPEKAFQFKLKALEVEELFASNNKRKINIDPGILSLHNIILFSTKNFSHRIACGDGIYSEVTCLLGPKGISSLPWTYPDFMQKQIESFFLDMRRTYHNKLRSLA